MLITKVMSPNVPLRNPSTDGSDELRHRVRHVLARGDALPTGHLSAGVLEAFEPSKQHGRATVETT